MAALLILRGLAAPARYLLALILMPAIAAAGLSVLASFGIYWEVCPTSLLSGLTRLLGFWALLLAVVALPSWLLKVDSTYLMVAVSLLLLAFLGLTRFSLPV